MISRYLLFLLANEMLKKMIVNLPLISFKIKLKDLNKSEMDTFGNATHLIINNKQIPLIAEGKKLCRDEI